VTTIDETDPRHVRFTSDGTFPGPPYCPGGSDFELRAIFDGWRQAAQTSPTQVLTGSFVTSAVTVAFSPFVANPDCVSGAKGLTNMSSHVSAIGVMQGEVNMNRFVLAHEIGHAVGMPGDINVSSSLCPNLMCAAAFNSHIPACEIRDGVVLSPPPYNCTPVAGEVSTPLASCDQARAVAKSIAMGAGIPLP
jgi:hypothetical protein